ncbi:SDR family oxidoreductase [Larkinella knui]|uniref:SDR family NAD(P)-dependent oxidoreductase n=1 Tax=Larkinella knui TaxID=2025310 RepID=A0A3P1CY80_9BACT|nr:SDR family oxidoreductase [Larkinella knui]RRB18118.1 SDR family NAD(P)-dependent oxidoreductase [Larkinella knui]
MKVSFKPLKEQVMVITGASSGIGLATAHEAAKQGVKLVLASRNEAALAEVVAQINGRGGHAVYVVADVGRREDVQRIAETAIEHFGSFDTWVNDAGLSIWGRLDEVSDEDHHRLFDTNFWGVVYGSLVAVPYLKKQGGTLINLGSVASDVAFPLQGMYCASKHAIKGFTDALRIELEEEGAPVSVTLIKPAAINTPFTEHARNYMDKEPKLPPPVYDPQEVVNAILHAATLPERDIYIGSGGKAMSSFNKYAPRLMDRVSETVMVGQQRRNEPPRNPAGALHQPGRDGRVYGDHPGHVMKTSFYTRASLHPLITGALVATVGLATAALLRRDGKGTKARWKALV